MRNQLARRHSSVFGMFFSATDYATPAELYQEMILDELKEEDVKKVMNELRLSKDAEGIDVLSPEEVKGPIWNDVDAGIYNS